MRNSFGQNHPFYPRLAGVPGVKLSNGLGVPVLLLLIVMAQVTSAFPQARAYPKEIRGYKVERRVVELKKPEKQNGKSGANAGTNSGTGPATGQSQSGNNNSNAQSSNQADPAFDENALIRLGTPQLARATPLGITFEVPIVVSPVKQSGRIDFLLFEDMVVNGNSVDIAEYRRAFDLPNKNPLTLVEPLNIYIYLPSALLAAIGEWSDSKETWPVTGRVYACGKFKKILTFKRCIPVELNVTMRNPLREH